LKSLGQPTWPVAVFNAADPRAGPRRLIEARKLERGV